MQKSAIKLLASADGFSLFNAMCGFTAIFFALQNVLWMSGLFILVAVLGDGLDGLLTRRFGSGELGESLDALADFIAFCVAPSVVVLKSYVANHVLYLTAAVLAFYILTSVIRLSAFPFLKQNHRFIGLPTPSAGAIVVLMVLLYFEWYLMLPTMCILSLLMISNISFPKIDNKLAFVATVLIINVLILKDSYSSIAPLLLLVALFMYVVLGPLILHLSFEH
ncbi:MAG TPA: hypothetical protein EYP23_02525 [Thermoplasmata archaeon]|nr:hypothetical protein [Thermoplasmata archaeon]